MSRMPSIVLFALLMLSLSSCKSSKTGDSGKTNPSEKGAIPALAGDPASPPAGGASKELTLDLGGAAMKLVLIPAGKFTMGSPEGEKDRQRHEGPQREVTISKAFYMGVCEVTQEQYEAIMGKNPSAFKDAKNPVERVSWNDAVEFCKALTAKTGKTVRLPTEAECEYACRAGTKTRFSFGDADADLYKYGNYCDKSNTNGVSWKDEAHDDGHDKTAPVGSYKPNAWGLYDMYGNVAEWCSDWYADSYAKAGTRDPQGPDSGSLRVLRGGGWYDNPRRCRSARRHYYPPVFRRINYGFRVAVDLK
ncbi:MAG: formylglycine-generating enzyme family protein [Planctomycetota bacterium]|nr:formylglycine-generating enzyme family protein [Planctomycetota bacterium]